MRGPITTAGKSVAASHAALAICEALLLALIETGSLTPDQADGLLQDAAEAHRNAPAGKRKANHDAAAEAIEDVRKQVRAAGP